MTEPSFLVATRVAYDTVAVDYAELARDALAGNTFDRAMLDAFAEVVSGSVADIGCGPGRISGYLHSRGVDVRGIDLSPGMVAVARETYPELRFDVGSMTDLDLADSALGGVVAWYSVIHIPPALRPSVFAGFHRVLKAGGHLLMAFQVGDERRHIEHAYGHPLSLDSYRMPPDGVAHLLSEAGFVLDASLVRRPEGPEKVDQAYLLAHKV